MSVFSNPNICFAEFGKSSIGRDIRDICDYLSNMSVVFEGKRILIFGGSGSLGNALVDRYLGTNELYVYSRDECKHWAMQMKYHNNPNLSFVIGDVRDRCKVATTIQRVRPHIIIIAAAMKHIDRCEYETHECIQTNIVGIKNVLDVVEEGALSFVESVCFVSTDKACSPVNIYGMCKAVCECMMAEKAKMLSEMSECKFVTVRYGNVLNSRGSIIPTLHTIGQDPAKTSFVLTSPEMTRFLMTLDESVDLIEYAITQGESGDIVIPTLRSMWVKDLLELFSEKYNKPVVITKLRPGEKLYESLINETQSSRLVHGKNGYMIIKPTFKDVAHSELVQREMRDYNSREGLLSKEALRSYLSPLNML